MTSMRSRSAGWIGSSMFAVAMNITCDRSKGDAEVVVAEA